ncbi:PD-(D/E)XK nuclease family protein [uncultured Microscilla sp.]|uniref:PD-(D/E)XK nuclease family protein n=1 Tax=uncultured Microscilla sp. TaxID=432653 RepID=UPI0026249256|nr:PD-(D/E)XK nuclease family protein [uncultured Microscilla sp.]
MRWSFSSYRQFKGCKRQWFYQNKMANANATKDPERKEAAILRNLQSLNAWRGSMVDYIIGKEVIPYLQQGIWPQYQDVIAAMKALFQEQYAFAKAKKYREEGLTKTKAGESFLALYDLEYAPEKITREALNQAYLEAVKALKNLFHNQRFLEYLRSASRLITQRQDLQVKYNEHFTLKAIPDLLVFEEHPFRVHIIDWKVHSKAQRTYEEQLRLYAWIIKKGARPRDFPEALDNLPITSIQLTEYQLLTNEMRTYDISLENVLEIEQNIAQSIDEMTAAQTYLKYQQLEEANFPANRSEENCQGCRFRKICEQPTPSQAQTSLF